MVSRITMETLNKTLLPFLVDPFLELDPIAEPFRNLNSDDRLRMNVTLTSTVEIQPTLGGLVKCVLNTAVAFMSEGITIYSKFVQKL